ncbi:MULTISPECIES: restriction endonuclease subunit S [Lysinibacillus]|uniref:restriction endonuclease subunit S n=1 Tax=Lysinibacillus TaxID=400634 RepID=UPI0018CCEEB4|nr:restriction endonuclease subunit S [Lysinibacillus sphaericus]QTB12941.1 restriction endonuclease subunit S [Lysinibacillus sphaericus]
MKNNRYLDYIDSRYEWLGEIPLHWELKRAKWGFQEKSIKGYPEETLLSVSKGKGVIPRDELENKTVMAFKDLENFKLVVPEDFVIHLRSFQSGFEMSTNKGIVSPAYTVFSCGNDLVPKYYKFLFYTQSFIDAIASTTQSLRDGKPIAYKDFSDMELPYPSLNEQIKIAKFLEVKLARIDNLIDMKEKLILLLNNQRQSIITEAVTKGLNPNVKMKDSGVQWIGEIPEHWEVKKLKHLGKFVSGYAFPSNAFISDGTKVMKINNIQTMNLDWSDISYVANDWLERFKQYQLKRGDLVIALTRPIISTGIKAAIVDTDEEILLNQRNAYFRNNKLIPSNWLYYLLLNHSFVEEFESLIDRTGQQPNISTADIENIKIPLPSFEEIQQITDYLKDRSTEIEKIKVNTLIQIEKLKEYRQSLIYEAVTGKIDVREIELD